MSGGERGSLRLRFAPDPRADLNVAGARIALVNWLLARHLGGSMVLRIEDRDPSRPAAGGIQELIDNLHWLGLYWDEGPDVGGDRGPYRQSERMSHYREFASRLEERDQVYPCFCTPEELAARNRDARRAGQAPRYSGRCRGLSRGDRLQMEARGLRPTLRFKAPSGGYTLVEDMLRGSVQVDNRRLDDFVILRRDGVFTYNFCCVVDDYLMDITHVIRGEEHVTNTPRQVWLYDALDLKAPAFIHLGRVTEPDGSRLGRGHGAAAISELKERGVLPEVLIQFLAGLAGQDVSSGQDLTDIAAGFSVDHLKRAPVAYARKHLYTLNARYLRRLSADELAELALPYLERAGIWPRSGRDEKWLKMAISLIREEVVVLSDVPHYLTPLVDSVSVTDAGRLDQLLDASTAVPVLKAWIEDLSRAGPAEEWDIRDMAQSIRRRLGIQSRETFMPLRVALTGRSSGPEIHRILTLLGREQVIERLLRAHRQMQ